MKIKNMNDFAKAVTKHEGLKKQVDIAQVKEIIRVFAEIYIASFNANFVYGQYLQRKMRDRKNKRNKQKLQTKKGKRRK